MNNIQKRKPLPFRRLPARYAGIVMPFILSVLMTGVVSIIATMLNIGLKAEVLTAWPRAWGASWLVAFPALLFLLPLVRRIVGRIVEPA